LNRVLIALISLLILLVAAGCGTGVSDAPAAPIAPAATPTTAAEQAPAPTSEVKTGGVGGLAAAPSTPAPTGQSAGVEGGVVQPALASSELVVGSERFVFGLLDPQTRQPINDVPEVSIQFFKIHDDGTATKTGDAQPIYRSENLPAGVYVVRTDFSEPGKWGALMLIKRDGFEAYQVKAEFDVLERGSVPMVGDAAPLSKNLTAKDVQDVGEICSAAPRDNMHDLTIAEAVQSGKPTIVLFAAPGFCPSFTCGPDLEMVQKLQSKYGDKANFVHIESPNEIQNHAHEGPVDPDHDQEPGHQGVSKPQVETAREWGLKTEPWLFLVDKDGKVANRFEGGLTLDEVEPAFLEVIQ
jgi:hypothetical protein